MAFKIWDISCLTSSCFPSSRRSMLRSPSQSYHSLSHKNAIPGSVSSFNTSCDSHSSTSWLKYTAGRPAVRRLELPLRDESRASFSSTEASRSEYRMLRSIPFFKPSLPSSSCLMPGRSTLASKKLPLPIASSDVYGRMEHYHFSIRTNSTLDQKRQDEVSRLEHHESCVCPVSWGRLPSLGSSSVTHDS